MSYVLESLRLHPHETGGKLIYIETAVDLTQLQRALTSNSNE